MRHHSLKNVAIDVPPSVEMEVQKELERNFGVHSNLSLCHNWNQMTTAARTGPVALLSEPLEELSISEKESQACS